MDFSVHAVQVVTFVAALRHFLPKLDGWAVVVVVLLASVGLSAYDLRQAYADGVSLAEAFDLLGESVTIFALAFGGWNAVKRALREARPPELTGDFIELGAVESVSGGEPIVPLPPAAKKEQP